MTQIRLPLLKWPPASRHCVARVGQALCAILVLLSGPFALADGGTLRLSQRKGGLQVSIFTSPERLQVGPVDVSVLIQEVDTGTCNTEIPVTVRLERLDSPAIPLEQFATTTAATNKLFQAAVFEIPNPGDWRATVWIGSEEDAEKLVLDLEIGPPPPAWIDLAGWLGWPFLVLAVFVAHQRLKLSSEKPSAV